MQAAFLVPMAVSLAFGVLFATFITFILTVRPLAATRRQACETPGRLRDGCRLVSEPPAGIPRSVL